jgi:hypothetical protein
MFGEKRKKKKEGLNALISDRWNSERYGRQIIIGPAI